MKNIIDLFHRKSHPVRFVQFGEGNFLRAFVDYGIDVANEEKGFNSSVAVVIPIAAGGKERFEKQDNLYTVLLRGQRDGKPYKENRVVTCIDRVVNSVHDYDAYMDCAKIDTLEFVVSNTTEAGIVYEDGDKLDDCPPKSFPAKLTKFLYTRYQHFDGDKEKGLIMLPVELIDHNGETLKKCVDMYVKKWNLPQEFQDWLNNACIFASTLVDRIVAGYPREEAAKYEAELGYHDELMDQGEPFGLWVIGDSRIKEKLPLASSKLQVEFTDEIEKFKERKVRILNGAHTSMVLGAYLAGFNFVGECMKDASIRKQLEESVFGEIVPTVHLPEEKARAFAKSVFERFENPFVHHALLSISLNSISKWRARVLPSLKDSIHNTGKLPKWLTYSLAALLAFYHTAEAGDGCLIGHREGNSYEIHDDPDKLEQVKELAGKTDAEYVHEILAKETWWGEDLTQIPGFEEAVQKHFDNIRKIGAKAYIEELANQGA